MEYTFTMEEDQIVYEMRQEISELKQQLNKLQNKYDKLVGKLKKKNITPEQQEIISIFKPKFNNFLN